MKKKIAIWLFKLARRLYPISVTVFEQKEILEPKVCAKAYSIDKNYIRHYKRDHHVKSMREALREIIKETLAQAKKDVLNTIESKIMKQRVYQKDGKTIIEVKVNCYVSKEEG
jgi:hypothetical protein|nr:MAG TPA: hypothetical protein [Caudoviricetes sp.]